MHHKPLWRILESAFWKVQFAFNKLNRLLFVCCGVALHVAMLKRVYYIEENTALADFIVRLRFQSTSFAKSFSELSQSYKLRSWGYLSSITFVYFRSPMTYTFSFLSYPDERNTNRILISPWLAKIRRARVQATETQQDCKKNKDAKS